MSRLDIIDLGKGVMAKIDGADGVLLQLDDAGDAMPTEIAISATQFDLLMAWYAFNMAKAANEGR